MTINWLYFQTYFTTVPNYLIAYLKTLIPTSFIDRIIIDYHIASTPDHATIFLQLDLNGNCRTGKIIQYDPATGHRSKTKQFLDASPGSIHVSNVATSFPKTGK